MGHFLRKHICGLAIFFLIFYVGENIRKIMGPIRRRGYHCEDDSIKQPYVKDTISVVSLYVIGLIIPLCVMTLNELLQHRWMKRNAQPQLGGFCQYLSNLWDVVMPFLYGFATERFLKNAAKFTVARLRPHFYTVCQPLTMKGVLCEDDFAYTSSPPFYVAVYKCSAAAKLSDSIFTSFPSGHSSLSFYGLVYTVIYLQRFAWANQKHVASYGPVVPLVQLICFVLAAGVAVSRVFDYKHFWSDILAGSALGIIVAVAFSFYGAKYRADNARSLKKQQMDGVALNQIETLAGAAGANNVTGCAIAMGDS